MRERVVWVDYVKVVCISLMIACHVGQEVFSPVWIYQFHMPAFFIVSGFLFKPRPVIKNVRSFLTPVLLYSTINMGFNSLSLIHAHNCAWGGVIKAWMESFWIFRQGELFPGIWFIVCLLAMRVMFSFDCCRKRAYTIAALCCLWMMVSPYFVNDSTVSQFHIYHVFASVPFFVAGLWIKEHPDAFQRATNCRFEIKLGLVVIFWGICSLQGFCEILRNSFGFNYFIYMLNAFIGSFLLICTCRYLPERKYIVTLSCGTFLLLGLHRTISGCNVMVLFQPLGLDGSYVPLLNTALIMLWCYPLVRLMMKCPILLGK